MRYLILAAFLLMGCHHDLSAKNQGEAQTFDGDINVGTFNSDVDTKVSRTKSDYQICLDTYRGLPTAEAECKKHMEQGL